MGMGQTRTGPTDKIELDIPEGAPLTITEGAKGTMGLLMSKEIIIKGKKTKYPKWVSAKSPATIMKFIQYQSLTYGKYQPQIWDCEDWAYLAAADVRRRFPGQPVGILLGKGTYGPTETIKGKDHAINILWFEDDVDGQKVWKPRYFDATLKKEITKEMADPEFETRIVVPIPPGCSNNRDDYKKCSPFERFDFLKTATLALDRIGYDYEAIDDIKNKLIEWSNTGFGQIGLGEIERALYSNIDLAFYYFAQIRRWYAIDRNQENGNLHPPEKASPVGAAFGKVGKTEFGVLILWKSKSEYMYWNVTGGDEDKFDKALKKSSFKPRLIIV